MWTVNPTLSLAHRNLLWLMGNITGTLKHSCSIVEITSESNCRFAVNFDSIDWSHFLIKYQLYLRELCITIIQRHLKQSFHYLICIMSVHHPFLILTALWYAFCILLCFFISFTSGLKITFSVSLMCIFCLFVLPCFKSISFNLSDMCGCWEAKRMGSLWRWFKACKVSVDLFATSQWQSRHLFQAAVGAVSSRLSCHRCKLANCVKTAWLTSTLCLVKYGYNELSSTEFV